MIGVIAGDVIGSVYEHQATKSPDFPLFADGCRFTDDTVMTIATASAILNEVPYQDVYRALGQRYPNAGYGGSFFQWLHAPTPHPYNSWGNGSAMRVAPVGLAFETEQAVLREAEKSAAVTHDHAEGVKGAQATALAVFRARTGASKEEIREELSERFDYDLARSVDEIRPEYEFDVSCQGSVPESIIAFLESRNLEDAIRLAISLGGDADTMAAIAGGIAHAFYREVPRAIEQGVRDRLPDEFLDVVDAFERAYPLGR
jgi:ADP-ribosylglycohydrolase